MVPGIDFAGRVHTSEDPRFHAGQQVLLTGWGVGENHWGGPAAQARVKGDWLVPGPGLSASGPASHLLRAPALPVRPSGFHLRPSR